MQLLLSIIVDFCINAAAAAPRHARAVAGDRTIVTGVRTVAYNAIVTGKINTWYAGSMDTRAVATTGVQENLLP